MQSIPKLVFIADGTMLSRTSTQLFTMLHPTYRFFQSTLIERNTNQQNNMRANVQSLSTFTIVHDLGKEDINRTRYALMIMKKRTYRGYVFWLKNRGVSSDIRIAPNKLDTKMNIEQFIMVHNKYHPYSEELNHFILLLEVSPTYH